jgi:hypothetical protein
VPDPAGSTVPTMAPRPDPYAILDEPRPRWRRRPLRPAFLAPLLVLAIFLGALYYVSTQAKDDSRVPTPIGGNLPQQR